MLSVKVFIIVAVGLIFLSCDLANQENEESNGSILGTWEQTEKKTSVSSGWVPVGSSSFYIVTFESNGTHTIQQGNFINRYDCTGTWIARGNALTMTNDCGHGESKENLHYSIADTTMTWVYDFSEVGKKFKLDSSQL